MPGSRLEATRTGADDSVNRTLDQELNLVRDAISLVASGGSARVILAGLQFGEPLIEPARRMARGRGVRIRPIWNTDESGADLAIERADVE